MTSGVIVILGGVMEEVNTGYMDEEDVEHSLKVTFPILMKETVGGLEFLDFIPVSVVLFLP